MTNKFNIIYTIIFYRLINWKLILLNIIYKLLTRSKIN
ncbi:putative membrane protein [Wolbachia pipientis wVitA]|nr:putative membrane protein [Wolbachia pipientis wVitA]